jgi:putative oxidoreductase
MIAILKQSLNPGKLPSHVSVALLFLRIIVGTFMITHGYGKMLMLFGEGPVQFIDPLGVGVTTSLALVVFAEVLCSVFLIVGVGTRLASIPLLFTMFMAGFIVHGSDPFSVRELALFFGSTYVFFLITGPGKYSIDQLLFKR